MSRNFASEMKITVKMVGLTYNKGYILLLNISCYYQDADHLMKFL